MGEGHEIHQGCYSREATQRASGICLSHSSLLRVSTVSTSSTALWPKNNLSSQGTQFIGNRIVHHQMWLMKNILVSPSGCIEANSSMCCWSLLSRMADISAETTCLAGNDQPTGEEESIRLFIFFTSITWNIWLEQQHMHTSHCLQVLPHHLCPSPALDNLSLLMKLSPGLLERWVGKSLNNMET